MVNSNFGLNLDAAMSFDKMDLLWSSLEIVEDSFRRNGKDKRPVYIKYMYRVLEKIILSDPDLDLQNLIIRYITVTINCVVNRRQIPLREEVIDDIVNEIHENPKR